MWGAMWSNGYVYTANAKSIGGKPCIGEFKPNYPNLCYSVRRYVLYILKIYLSVSFYR